MTTTLLRAADWGMRWARPPVAQSMPVRRHYIHHSAGSHPTDPAQAFRELNEYAIDIKGYSAVHYSMLVRGSTLGEARGKWLPAATRDDNIGSKATCVLGYFHPGHRLSRRPTDDELHAAAESHVHMVGWDWLTRGAEILGHRDNRAFPDGQPTACPGDLLYVELPTIRTIAADLLAGDTYVPDPPEDDMTKRLLARHQANPYHLRVGDGIRAEVLRSREYGYVVNHFGEPSCPTYFHPLTGAVLDELDDVPTMSETQLDLWVGYETGAALKDEG